MLLTPSALPAGVRARGTLDLAGAAAATVGLGSVVFAIVPAPEVGWTAGTTLLAGLLGLALLAAFVALQAKRRQPLMRLGIFRVPNLAAANVAQLLLGAAWIPMFVFLSLTLAQVYGFGAFKSGAALLPLTVTIMIGMIAVAPKLTARDGPKTMTVADLATLAVGLVWLSRLDATAPSSSTCCPRRSSSPPEWRWRSSPRSKPPCPRRHRRRAASPPESSTPATSSDRRSVSPR